MNFKDIKMNIQDKYNTFTFNNQEIKVLKYLPISEKFDLIMVSLQKSIVNGIYNPIRLKTFFRLNIAYLYTDIIFDIEDRIDEGGLYDNLVTSGLMNMIEENMEEAELEELHKLFDECYKTECSYRTTAAAMIAKLVDDLPKNAEAAKNIVDNFDKEKYSEVLETMQKLK